MAGPVFLPQAQPVYPTSANFAPQLALLGETIGQTIGHHQRLKLLGDVQRKLASGEIDYAKAAVAASSIDSRMAALFATLGQNQAQNAHAAAALEETKRYHTGQLGVSQGQLAIARETAKRAAAQDALKTGLLQQILGPQPAPVAAQPPAGALAAAPANFDARFNPNAPAPVPSMTAQPAITGTQAPLGGVPRDEMALSMLGYGDAAKAMRSARESTPQAIYEKTRATETAKDAVGKELNAPEAEAKAQESIQGIFKAGTEALRLAKHPGLNAAVGPIDQYIPAVRDKTANFRADLETLGTKVFITTLNRMRELSKTGGAVGSVTEKEMAKLENSMRSFSTGQGQDNMRKNLGLLADDFNDSMANIAAAYKAQYGKDLKYTPLKTGGGNASGASNLPALPAGFQLVQ